MVDGIVIVERRVLPRPPLLYMLNISTPRVINPFIKTTFDKAEQLGNALLPVIKIKINWNIIINYSNGKPILVIVEGIVTVVNRVGVADVGEYIENMFEPIIVNPVVKSTELILVHR